MEPNRSRSVPGAGRGAERWCPPRRGGLVRTLLLALVMLVPAVTGSALSLSTLDVRAGLLWLGNAGDGQVVAPSPIMDYLGVSLPLAMSGSLTFVPEIDLFGTQYQLANGGTRAIPTEIEYQSSVWLLNVLVDPAFRYQFHLSKLFSWGVSVSPALLFRIPTVSWDLTSQQIGAITLYFYSKARFFYPGVGAFFLWQMFPNLGLEGRLRGFFPVFHFWDGEGQPFYDQLMVDGSLGFRLKIGR